MYCGVERQSEGSVYEYVCDHIIPGCDFKARTETHEAMEKEAEKHLREHHNMDYLDKDILQQVNKAGIWAIPMQ